MPKKLSLIFALCCVFKISYSQNWNFVLPDTPMVADRDIYAYLHTDDTISVTSDVDNKDLLFRRFPAAGTTKLNFGSVGLPGLYTFKIVGSHQANKDSILYQYLIYPPPPNPDIMPRSLIKPEQPIGDPGLFISLIDSVNSNIQHINQRLDTLMIKSYNSSAEFGCKYDSVQADSLNYVVFFTKQNPTLVITIETDSDNVDNNANIDLVFKFIDQVIDSSRLSDTTTAKFHELINLVKTNRGYRTVYVKNIYRYLIGSYFGLEDGSLCNKASLYLKKGYFDQLIFMVKIKKKGNGNLIVKSLNEQKNTSSKIENEANLPVVEKDNIDIMRPDTADNKENYFESSDTSFQFSGIAVAENKIFLVAEKSNKIYSFQKDFKNNTVKNIDSFDLKNKIHEIKGDTDAELEGMTFYRKNIFLVDEKHKRIYSYDKEQNKLSQVNLYNPKILDSLNNGKKNEYGLEGITVNESKHLCYILRESNDANESEIYVFKIEESSGIYHLRFVNKKSIGQPSKTRYSDICYFDSNLYAIKSKKSEVYKIDRIPIDDHGIPSISNSSDAESQDVKTEVAKHNIEGIWVDKYNIYLVSDNFQGTGKDIDGKTILIRIENKLLRKLQK